ncbi:MAG: nuclear transport factor 2 family protein [Pseudomonadota bacterium]
MSAANPEREAMDMSSRLSKAFGLKDIEAIADLYGESIVVWHNHTNSSEGKSENIASLSDFFGLFSSVSYEDIKLTPTNAGFVQQHVIRGRLAANDRLVELPVCLVAQIEGSKIVRLDEYADPAPLFQALPQ